MDDTTPPPARVAVPRSAEPLQVEIRRCLGLTTAPDGPRPVHLVLQRADGGLHVLQLDYPTALAISLAIRADIRF